MIYKYIEPNKPSSNTGCWKLLFNYILIIIINKKFYSIVNTVNGKTSTLF